MMDFEGLSPACYECASELKIEELLKRKAALGKNGQFVQLFENNNDIIEKLLAAYLNSLIRYKEKNMRSAEVSNEMLALASGQMNIGKAIRKVGIKDGKNFLLFLSDKKIATKAKQELGIVKMKEIKLKLDPNFSSQVAITPLLED